MKHNEAVTMVDGKIDEWLEALHARHVAPYRPKEFTHALQALSVRYVERRKELPGRSPLDTAGKRAAFAAFYAPLHFLTIRAILAEVAGDSAPGRIADLGCGTGVCGAAWALGQASDRGARREAVIVGVDDNQWAVDEARWNLKTLGVNGRVTRGDLTAVVRSSLAVDAIVAGWAVNELAKDSRDALLEKLVTFARGRGPVLIVEPLSHAVSPWWQEWVAAFTPGGGRADEWKFRVEQPATLKELSHRAGFRRDVLGARSIWAAPGASAGPGAPPITTS
jgi:precorrin-6B methylase 2